MGGNLMVSMPAGITLAPPEVAEKRGRPCNRNNAVLLQFFFRHSRSRRKCTVCPESSWTKRPETATRAAAANTTGNAEAISARVARTETAS
jgi:hypothetical protein